MSLVSYVIVRDTSIDGLELAVRDLHERGYVCAGGVCGYLCDDRTNYMQAMEYQEPIAEVVCGCGQVIR